MDPVMEAMALSYWPMASLMLVSVPYSAARGVQMLVVSEPAMRVAALRMKP